MKKLREEIQERIILMMTADWGGTDKEATDDILKLFEKRIDDYIADYDNFCHDCAIQNLEDIKEMLKK